LQKKGKIREREREREREQCPKLEVPMKLKPKRRASSKEAS
jgi:hypothetical protein